LRKPQPTLSWKRRGVAVISSIAVRIIVTSAANVLLLPIFLGKFYPTTEAVVANIHLMAVFNHIQGAISSMGGLLIHEGIKRRIPVLRS